MIEQISFGKENDDARGGYEKSVSELVHKCNKSFNSFIENLIGKENISKEDIIRIDAEIQNTFFDKIKHNEGLFAIYGNQYGQNFEKEIENEKKQLDILSKSVLDASSEINEEGRVISTTMNGKIREKKVLIKRGLDKDGAWLDEYNGTLDGKEMSKEEAKQIFETQYALLQERWDKIRELILKRRKERID